MKGIRLVLLAVSVAVVGLSVAFFARQDLGSADQYASVASFFVGLGGLAASSWSLVSARRKAQEPPPAASGVNISVHDSKVVQIGPNNHAELREGP